MIIQATIFLFAVSIFSILQGTDARHPQTKKLKRWQNDNHWIPTWGSMPQLTEPANLPSPPFNQTGEVFYNSTIRQTIHTSIGGSQIRIQISNAFGIYDLPITAVTVALPVNGSAGISGIQPHSLKSVTFSGSANYTIPQGALVVSDPIDIEVAPQSMLTDYVVVDPGEPSVCGELDRVITCERWPDLLLAKMQKDPDTLNIAVINEAAGGNRLLYDGLGPNGLSRIDRDVLSHPNVEYAMLFIGVNDIGTASTSPSSQQNVGNRLIAAYKQIVLRLHSFDIKVFASTITPFSAPGFNVTVQGYSDVEREKTRQRVNGWIRDSGVFDEVIDFDAIVRDPEAEAELSAEYNSGDYLHPNVAGYQRIADTFPLSVFELQKGRWTVMSMTMLSTTRSTTMAATEGKREIALVADIDINIHQPQDHDQYLDEEQKPSNSASNTILPSTPTPAVPDNTEYDNFSDCIHGDTEEDLDPNHSGSLYDVSTLQGCERLDRYVNGATLPVHLGDLINHRYRVMLKIGHGSYSTVWLAADVRNQHVALKFLRDGEKDELHWHDLERKQQLNFKTPPFQLVQGVRFLHGSGMTHGDLSLGNVALRIPNHQRGIHAFQKFYDAPRTLVIVPDHNFFMSPFSYFPRYLTSNNTFSDYVKEEIGLSLCRALKKAYASSALESAKIQILDPSNLTTNPVSRVANLSPPTPLPSITCHIRGPEFATNDINSNAVPKVGGFPCGVWVLACTMCALVFGPTYPFENTEFGPEEFLWEIQQKIGSLPASWVIPELPKPVPWEFWFHDTLNWPDTFWQGLVTGYKGPCRWEQDELEGLIRLRLGS
ncbi:hypothetical protein G7Y89_g3622 [Cudoniella acicularis]|uniref:Protein kinase domain-containing protein n=1 Tax=Cudoniella acicularis TaxID=354080 RepID=A0A8H4RT49_9HELO|nr:hypothetical protein G7Y89_g3622 [Cudoniella acicularis]